MAGVNILHVPYKGGGPAMFDVISGHVKIMFSSLIQTMPNIQSGKLKALGTGGARRLPILPDVPAIAETVPGYEATNWWGIVVPAGTPAPIVEKLYRDIQAVLKSPDLLAQFAREGAAVVEMSSPEFGRYMETEMAKWARVIKEATSSRSRVGQARSAVYPMRALDARIRSLWVCFRSTHPTSYDQM